MVFQFTQVSDVGTSNPIVARLTVGMHDFLELAGPSLGEAKKLESRKLTYEVKTALVSGEKALMPLLLRMKEIEAQFLLNGPDLQSDGRVVNVPAILNLDNAKVFLKFSRDALNILAKLMGILIDGNFNGPHFHVVRDHAIKKLGSAHQLSQLLAEDQKWIKHIIDLRNEDEHPGSGKPFMSGYSIQFKGASAGLEVPRFYDNTPVFNLEIYANNLLTFAEEIIILSLKQHLPKFVGITEIPESNRDRSCPIRFRTSLVRSEIIFPPNQEAT